MFKINNLLSKSNPKKNKNDSEGMSSEEWLAIFQKYPDLAKKWDQFFNELVYEAKQLCENILTDAESMENSITMDQDKHRAMDEDYFKRMSELTIIMNEVLNCEVAKDFKPFFESSLKDFTKE